MLAELAEGLLEELLRAAITGVVHFIAVKHGTRGALREHARDVARGGDDGGQEG